MSNNPINLALRFILEILALVALAYWGWTQQTGLGHILWALALPTLAAVLWGTFRVPDDPGKAPVAVPGAVRLALVLVIFGAAVMALYNAGLILEEVQRDLILETGSTALFRSSAQGRVEERIIHERRGRIGEGYNRT